MTTLSQISQFIEAQPLALVGASRNPKKFGHTAFKELREKGMKLIPVNPEAEQIMGEKCYTSISSLPAEVKGVIIMTKKDKTAAAVREAKGKGIRQIWIQQMAESSEAMEELKGTDINYITGECILMHYNPKGVHKFHMRLKKLFGRFPR